MKELMDSISNLLNFLFPFAAGKMKHDIDQMPPYKRYVEHDRLMDELERRKKHGR